jgi:hypothetical protein
VTKGLFEGEAEIVQTSFETLAVSKLSFFFLALLLLLLLQWPVSMMTMVVMMMAGDC